MLLVENVKIALRAIWANKIRASLTMLGVIIGVAAVITLIAMGEGVKAGVTSEIEAIGSNIIVVLPGKVLSDKEGLAGMAGMAGISSLTLDDKEAIKKEIDLIQNVSAIMLVSGDFVYQEKKAIPMLIGGEPDLEFAGLYNIKTGRFLSDQDVEDKKRVVVIGQTIVKDLFETEDPLGKKIEINKIEFEVIGTMETESLSTVGIDANLLAVIPISVSKELFETDRINRILMQAKTKENVEQIQKQVKELLISRHKGKEDFSVLTQEDILKMFEKVIGLITSLLSGIAAISLMVGGIGIMNIMLVSVTERTREIGIRKAMGATSGNILAQFLTEATVISLLGGGIGIVLSGVASTVISKISPIVPHITFFAIILAFCISCAVGIIFGVAPAIKAARKDPIEALRYE